MSNEDRPFQAGQVYEQLEQLSRAESQQTSQSSDARLISNLRQVYTEDREIVDHVWASLNARARANARQGAGQAPLKRYENLSEEEPQPMKKISNGKRPKSIFNRLLELSAALLVIGALVVGMIVLLQRAHQQPGPAGAPTVSATVSPHATSAPVGPTQTPDATQTAATCSVSHPATLTPLSGPTDPAVFYVTGGGGYQSVPSHTSLVRYDLATGKTTTLVQTPSDAAIISATLSPDKQWLLLRVATQNLQKIELQVIRTDGNMLQTVYEACAAGISFGNGMDAWSPNGLEIVVPDPATSVSVLDLTSGRMQRFFLPNNGSLSYGLAFWTDNQHLVLTRSDSPNASRVEVELLDISKGTHPAASDLTQITSIPTFCGKLAPGGNGSQVFTSSCTPFNGNCQWQQVQGPSSVNAVPASGGAIRTIYSSQSRAVTAIASAGSSSLLIYIETTRGDLSQDGLWKVNADGSGLTRLTTTHALACQYSQYAYPLTQISSDGTRYALLYMDGGEQKLIVGSLAGGTPTTILAHQLANRNVLVLAGIGVA